MRIALLSTNYDLGGAAIVTLRLTQALRALGHDARMVVARPGASAGSAIVVPKGQWLKAFLRERAHLWLHGVPHVCTISQEEPAILEGIVKVLEQIRQ